MTNELTVTNQELDRLQQEQAEKQRLYDEQDRAHHADLSALREEINSQMSTRKEFQDNLKRQAQIATDAQQSYEQELMKHAQAAESLQKLRNEYAELKSQVYGFKAEAEASKSMLDSSTSSWEEQKEIYEKEIQEVGARCDDLVKQNKLLHAQFEGVSQQIATLQKNRVQNDGEIEIANSDKSLEELREVIAYLRREKEIVDVQLELQTQESRRFKQQLDHSRTSLDEVRTQLQEERLRESESLKNMASHEDLMQRISELNILRESNSALRSEKDRYVKKNQELAQSIQTMTSQIQPLEDRVRDLEGELEMRDGQMKLLEEDNERWKERNNSILQKYDRIDPAELEALNEQLRSIQQQHDEAVARLALVDTNMVDKDAVIAAKEKEVTEVAALWRAKLDKIVNETKQRLADRRKQIDELKTNMDTLNQENADLKAKLQASSAQLEQAKNAQPTVDLSQLEGERAAWQSEKAGIEEQSRNRVEHLMQELVSL